MRKINVFCGKCAYYQKENSCMHPNLKQEIITPIQRKLLPMDCSFINRNNDCSYFSKLVSSKKP
jgi:hypothetical protein